MKSQKTFFSFKFEPAAPKKRRRRPERLRAAPPPELTIDQILEWADANHARTGQWPRQTSGPVYENRNERWFNINSALRLGQRGLPGGSSLAQLLGAERGRRNLKRLPPFTVEQILSWADAYRDATGSWPAGTSGPIEDAPGETWGAINSALHGGWRGLPGGSSLPRLLFEQRGRRSPQYKFIL